MENTLKLNNGVLDVSLAVASFGITVIRLAMIIFTSILILRVNQSYVEIAVISIALVMLFDYLDGKLFKLSSVNNIVKWRINRRLFDSFIDRAITHIGSISLLIIDSNFLLLYLLILLRDITISGYCTFQYRNGYLIYPKRIAKLSAFFIGLSIIAYLLNLFEITICLSIALMITSFYSLKEYMDSLKKFQFICSNTIKGQFYEIF